MRKIGIRLALGLMVFGFMAQAQNSNTLNLEQYLKQVQEKNRRVISAKTKRDASLAKHDSAGQNLEPVLTSKLLRLSDESQPNSLGAKSEITTAQVGIQKQFKSGTSASLTVTGNEVDVTNPIIPALGEYSTGTVELSLKQSLWKDGFGGNTKRVLERERLAAEIETAVSEIDFRKTLMTAETDFWDFLVAKEDLKLKIENLDRAQKLEKWTLNRVGNGISDQADLMNSRALVALRTVQLQTAEDEVKVQESKLRQNLELNSNDVLPVLVGDLEKSESQHIDRLRKTSNVLPLSAHLATQDARIKMLTAQERLDGQKPDLSAFATYASNSFDPTTADAMSNMTKGDLAKTSVGLTFSMAIGTGPKEAFRESNLGEARAAEIRMQKEIDEGAEAWKEFLRRYDVAKKNAESLKALSGFQDQRVKAERDKFSRGRTVTATVVTAETEAAEAMVSWLKAKSALRKLEATGLMFEGK